MASKRGNCPSCKREDVIMSGPKCPRCYDRIKRNVDVITGVPSKVFRAHDHTITPTVKPAIKPAAALTPALLADDEPENNSSGPSNSDFHLDLIDAIDDAWAQKRNTLKAQLLAAGNAADKLRIAFYTMASVKALGFEA